MNKHKDNLAETLEWLLVVSLMILGAFYSLGLLYLIFTVPIGKSY